MKYFVFCYIEIYRIVSKEIYAAMGEPDGVAGIDAIRENPASLHQQATVWENVGTSASPHLLIPLGLEFVG